MAELAAIGDLVRCKACGRAWLLTPADDYYQPEGQPEPAGTENGVCFSCLLRIGGLDPERTQVCAMEVDEDGRLAELDPRDEEAWPHV